MAYVEWSDTLSTGVQEIDEQHKTLIALLNELNEANERSDAGGSFDVVEKMKAYALTHFSTEERYMNKYKYPGSLDHLAEHASFVSKVKALDAHGKDPRIIPGVIKFLKQWLVEHISNMDIKMGRFLQDNLQVR
jgi:hemerythrin